MEIIILFPVYFFEKSNKFRNLRVGKLTKRNQVLYMAKNQNTPEIKQFIRENSSLFWYTPEDKKDEISLNLLVETILNYGDLDTIRELFSVIGMEKVADVLDKAEGRKKLNYFPEIYHYFTLVVNKYV